LEYQDLAYIKPLMADEIWYSLYATDNPGEKISKETFLSELERRLPNHPSCVAYHAQQGVIKYLVISTEGWSPPWEFEKREYGTMVFSFSDQWTKSEGLYLFGAFVSRPRPGLDFNELPCR